MGGVLLVSWAPEKLPKQVKNQHFLIFVPTWVCGRLGAVLEVSWKCLEPSLERIGTSWGRPGGSWNVLRGVFGSSWGELGASGRVWASCGVLGRLRTSWQHLGAVLGHLGGILKRFGASWGSVFGRLGGVLGRLETFSASQRRVGTKNQHQ